MAQKFVTPVTIRNLASASSDGLAVSVDGDTNDRIKFEAGGRVVWGSGASAGDVNLYRSAVGALKTDHTFEAESGIITLTTTGEPVASVADGALAVDTTNDDLYFRSNGAWKKVDNVAAVSDAPPSNPQEGDIWFESDTGDFFIYYSGAWVDIGGSSVANIAVTTTPPASPVNGDLWFDTDTAKTYVYYNDGTSGQWVEIGAASAASSGVDGSVQFSTGGTFDSSANLVWDDANNELEVTGVISATGGVVTLTSSGAPAASLADGAIAIDTTNDTFYFRSNSSWQQVTGGGGGTITSSTTDAALLIMEIGP